MAKPLTISFSILLILVLSHLAPTNAISFADPPTAESDQEALSPDYYYDDLAPFSAPAPQPASYGDEEEEDYYAPFQAPADLLYDTVVDYYAPFEAPAPSPTDDQLLYDGDYYYAPLESPSPTPEAGSSTLFEADDYAYAPFEAPALSPTELLYQEEDYVQGYAPLEAPTPSVEEEDYYAPFQAPAPSPTELLLYEDDLAPSTEAPGPALPYDYDYAVPSQAPVIDDYYTPSGAPGPALPYEDDYGVPLQAPGLSPVIDDYAPYDDAGAPGGPQLGMPAYEEDQHAPPSMEILGEMPEESTQQERPADTVEADDVDGSGGEEMNAAEGEGGGRWKKVAGVGVGVLGSACVLGIGAFVYNEKRKNGDKWRGRRRSDYASLYKKNETKNQEVELPMLAA